MERYTECILTKTVKIGSKAYLVGGTHVIFHFELDEKPGYSEISLSAMAFRAFRYHVPTVYLRSSNVIINKFKEDKPPLEETLP